MCEINLRFFAFSNVFGLNFLVLLLLKIKFFARKLFVVQVSCFSLREIQNVQNKAHCLCTLHGVRNVAFACLWYVLPCNLNPVGNLLQHYGTSTKTCKHSKKQRNLHKNRTKKNFSA